MPVGSTAGQEAGHLSLLQSIPYRGPQMLREVMKFSLIFPHFVCKEIQREQSTKNSPKLHQVKKIHK
jgi:hypothetical protein